ncbi:MAG: hypothetical protein H6Q38_2887 [Chloroflexi bacterium]|jgi:leucyl aminopeptidase (aminopeptidase T)|nr:hypothetical protein [Chloroflexota bacterium]
MAKPIYKVWFMNYKDPWYKLTTEEQNKLQKQVEESEKQVGGEYVMVCMSATEEWLAWGVVKYPDFESAQKHAENLFRMNWFDYVESKTYLGTEMPQA